MITIEHPRVYLPTETLGTWYAQPLDLKLPPSVTLIPLCKVMELPWKDNKRSISCFPEGTYPVTKEPPILKDDPNTEVDESGGRKPRDYWHFRIHNVPGRSGILVHKITYVKDLLGCQGVGGRFADLNKDGVPDIADSTKKLQWLVDHLPDQFLLHVFKKP